METPPRRKGYSSLVTPPFEPKRGEKRPPSRRPLERPLEVKKHRIGTKPGETIRCLADVRDSIKIYPNLPSDVCLTHFGYRTIAGELGRGTFGVVFQVCDISNNCDYVAKLQVLEGEDEKFDVAWEAFCQRRLSQACPKLVPKFKEAWICGGVGYYIMEKMDRNMEKVIERQGGLQMAQLVRMATICIQLGTRCGMVHGDVKPDNFLAKGNEIFIIDFGFSQFKDCDISAAPRHLSAGWLSAACIGGRQGCVVAPEDRQYWAEFNAWQLEKRLMYERTNIIFPNGRKQPFKGFLTQPYLISIQARRYFLANCVDITTVDSIMTRLLEIDQIMTTGTPEAIEAWVEGQIGPPSRS